LWHVSAIGTAKIQTMYVIECNPYVILLILLSGGKPGCSPVDSSVKGVDTKLYTLADFVLSAEIDNMNLYKLLQFCQKSKIAHKVRATELERKQSWSFVRYSPGIFQERLRKTMKNISQKSQ